MCIRDSYRRGVCKDALYASARHDNRGSAFCNSQTVAHANLITGAKIPEEKTRILRSVISDKLSEEGKTVSYTHLDVYKRQILMLRISR